MAEVERIAVIIMAAGRSSRMGQSKMDLPWGRTTVIGQVVNVFAQAGLSEIVVVTGWARQRVEAAVQGMPARCVHNPRYAEDYMILSLQAGLRSLSSRASAALVALGDQPQIQPEVIRRVIEVYHQGNALIVAPSYQMRRGHPWLIDRRLWSDLLELQPPYTPRDFLNAHQGEIAYVAVESDSVLRDLDTPEDYQRERPIKE
ncbi:MAG: nucleotidyltransferase family protein [Anaerolineales bacterium]|nr:nucleotidyltransferase family protein [Anaerolineales bacterium]